MTRRALVILTLAAALAPLAARAQTITAAPGGSITSLVGMPFDVPFYVDMTARPEKVGSFAARIQWNPAVLQFDGGSDGTFGAVSVNEDSLTAGVARVAGANPAGAGGLVTLGILHFTPLLAQADTLRFALPELYAAGTFAALTPVTTRDGYFCPARGMFGDIDKDGAINSRDALIALSNAVGLDVSAFDISLGDVDASGATNARDALIILSYAVGLPVPGFEVGRLAGGACASSLPLVMAIVPGTVDLLVGQTAALEARAADSSGVLQTVTNVIWRSGNPAVLAVAPDGSALAHDTGTVVVTAVRTALDSAQATVHIVPRRTRHIVDALATGARNQLGSAAFPFAQINQGIGFAQSGDTVEVRAGRYVEAVSLDRAAVLVGDTLPDGTRPLITGGSAFAGIELVGLGPRIVRDLAIDGFEAGVDMEGPSPVLLHGLRATNVYYGAGSGTPFGSLRLESSRFVGLGQTGESYEGSYSGLYFETLLDTLVLQDVDIGDFGGDGAYAPLVDSLALLRTRIHDVAGFGILGGPNASGGGPCHGEECGAPRRAAARVQLPPAASLALVMDSSEILRAGSTAVYLDGIRSAALSHSIVADNGWGVETYGLTGGWVRFTEDSIVQPPAESDYWLDAEYLDSLVMDSVSARSYYGGIYAWVVPAVSLSNSQFTAYSQQVLSVSGVSTGLLTLDNVIVSGDSSCDACLDGLDVSGPQVVADRVSLTNLNDAIDAYQIPGLTVTNSSFQHVYTGIRWYGYDVDPASQLVVKHTTFLGFYDAIEAENGGLQVDSSAFLNGTDQGISFYGSRRARVLGSTFASVPSAIYLEPYTADTVRFDTLAGNTVADLSEEGIYVDGDDQVHVAMLGNSVTCNAAGGAEGYALDLEFADGVVAGNRASGCADGVYVYDDVGSNPRADSVIGNLVLKPGAADAGIYVEGSIKSTIAHDTVSSDTAGQAGSGDIWVSGYGYQPGATTAIDSNWVTGGTMRGIYVEDVDTALVRWNTVQGVKGAGIVPTSGFTLLVQVYGNTVRGIFGDGMDLYNQGYSPDTALILVDSNLVASVTASGMILEGGAFVVLHNTVTGSGANGVAANGVDERSVVDSNNIVGNAFGMTSAGTVTAQYDWWGRSQGPKCAYGCDTTTTPAGDSVSYVGVSWQPPATSEWLTAPSPAAPVRVAARAPASVRTVRAPAPRGLDAPVAKRLRAAQAVRAAPAAVARAARPGEAGAAAPRPAPAHAPAWLQRAQQRTGIAARVTQHRAAVAAALARADALRVSLAQHAEQRQARREARLEAKQARRAVARPAVPRAHGALR